MTKTSPLPPIGKSRETTKAVSPVDIPAKVPIVLIMGKLSLKCHDQMFDLPGFTTSERLRSISSAIK